jgi:hypothetical protein
MRITANRANTDTRVVLVKPVITLVHSTGLHATVSSPHAGSLRDLDQCDPSESLIDVQFEGVSILQLGSKLPDPVRIIDGYVAERLIRASRWRVPIPLHRATDTLTSPEGFVFAADLKRRGFDEFKRDGLRNSVKRLRGVFRIVFPSPVDWFIKYDSRGYLFDLAHIEVRVVHLPQ